MIHENFKKIKESRERCRIINNSRTPTVIYVDADACPVKSEVSLIGIEEGYEIRFVASYDHKPNYEVSGKWIFVDPGSDSADLYILNHIKKHDILITEDIGLASLALAKGVYALSARGTEYKEESISLALDMRHISAKERRKGNYGRGPKPFTTQDRHHFLETFRRLLSKIEGIQEY